MTTPYRRGTSFPIVEAYGFPYDSTAQAAQQARDSKYCTFTKSRCEKMAQYGYGYCSVTYAAEWDARNPATYAVCDHRLDGPPVAHAIADHFGTEAAWLVQEVSISASPKQSIDYIAFREDQSARDGMDLIAIETQAIDLRGGGVGPAWRAWEEGKTADWRRYFTEEAAQKGRRDTVDYGINMSNVFKRLGTQIVLKGQLLREAAIPLYVITQDRILQQLRRRLSFEQTADSSPWDITFISFDYSGEV